MKSFLSLILSLHLAISPYAVAFGQTNLEGSEQQTREFTNSIVREREGVSSGPGGSGGSSSSNGPRGTSGNTSAPPRPTAPISGSGNKCAPGELYIAERNFCMKTEESARLKAEAEEACMVLTDPQLKANCINRLVTEKTSQAEQNGEMAGHSTSSSDIKLLPLLLAFTTLYAAIDHKLTKTMNCPGSKSSYLMIGGAVTLIATEILTKTVFSKELKNSQEKLTKLAQGSRTETSDNKNATNLQEEIFTALIERENCVIKAANAKKNGYNLAKLMFIGATIAAGLESIKFTSMMAMTVSIPAAKTLYICTDAMAKNSPHTDESELYAYLNYLETTGSKESFSDYQDKSHALNLSSVEDFQAEALDRYYYAAGHPSSLSLDDYTFIKLNRKKSDPKIDPLTLAFNAIKEIIIPEAKAFPSIIPINIAKMKGFKKFFLSPYSRLALSGMMTATTFVMTSHANKEIDKSNKRIEVLEKLKAQVAGPGVSIKCANGTEQGENGCEQIVPTTVKPGESNLGVVKSKDYGATKPTDTKSYQPKGCANADGQPDPECGCQKTKSCFSMPSNFKIGDISSADILGTGISSVNALTSGSISPAGLDTMALGKQLAAAGKMRDKILADVNKNPIAAAELKKAQEGMNGLQRQTFNSMPANMSAASMGLGSSGGSDFSGLDTNQILEKVKEELTEISAPTISNDPLPGMGEGDFKFDLGATEPMEALPESAPADATDINDFELAESEINPSSTTNIFEILSSRYKKSAYMRLLKSDKEITPEAPSNKEIND